MKNHISHFGTFARRGLLPLADHQKPKSQEGSMQFAAVKNVLGGLAGSLDTIVNDRSWVNETARTQALKTHLGAAQRQLQQARRDFDSFLVRYSEAERTLTQRRDHFERNFGTLQSARIMRRAAELDARALSGDDAEGLLRRAILRRDGEELAALYAARLPGAEAALEQYLLGPDEAERLGHMRSDRALLEQAHRIAEQGIHELAEEPEAAGALNLRPSPELALVVANAGVEALLPPKRVDLDATTTEPAPQDGAGGQP